MSIYCSICKTTTKFNSFSVFTLHHLKHVHNITAKQYYDNFLKTENEDICTQCQKTKTFISIKNGYRKYCSDNSCRNKNSDINNKKKQTFLTKYGKEHFNNPDKAKETLFKNGSNVHRIKKIKATKKERYNDENFNNTKKHKETCLEKYGVDSHFKDVHIKKKIEDVCLNKYGVKYNLQNKTTLDKTKNTMLKKYNGVGLQSSTILRKTQISKNKNEIEELKKTLDKINYTFVHWQPLKLKLKCPKNHVFDIDRVLFNYRHKYNHTICTECNPIGVFYSDSEKQLITFIKDNYNKTILENDRTVLNGKELDVYIPDLKLAFEFNGVYWHSELYKDENYHLNKTKICLKKGIHLIHIYEDDWMYKHDIIKSRILNLLGKSEKLYARKCTIKEVTSCVSKKFLEDNHVQGNVFSKYNIGLYFNNELVSLMTFGTSRFEKDKIELLRFCNKLNTTIIGGASRLFKYTTNTYNFKDVVSYADRSWSNGGLYKTLGFNLNKETKPNYSYVIGNKRENRFKYRKTNLIKDGFDATKTEKEIMFNRGIYRIYDSGSLKYIYDV